MKLFIQIPCFNEENFIVDTLNTLPKKINGIDEIEYLIIDDGSTDNTVEVARQWNPSLHILKMPGHSGLAKAFISGLEYCLKNGADIIVNTDADNQYNSDDIEKLISPIINNEAEMVIGARPIDAIETFSTSKKILQKFGSWVVRVISNSNVQDATSGFRAFSKVAASKINVFSSYTYTLETIIQAGLSGIPMISVPIRVNKQTRPSRLVKNVPDYIFKSLVAMLRFFLLYKPFRFFMIISLIFAIPGIALGIRYLVILASGAPGNHIQSLILATILIIAGIIFFIMGLLGDLIAVNRILLTDIKSNLRLSNINIKKD